MLVCTFASAQQVAAPKFAAKVQKALASLNTYDKDGVLLHTGTAVFIGNNGEALADYTLFRDAHKATVIDAKGTTYDVDCILGADDIYSLVRFRANIAKNDFLPLPTSALSEGNTLYAIPFSKGKMKTCASASVESAAPAAEKYSYYTLNQDMGSECVGIPLFNENGELAGMTQPAVKGKSGALDIRYANELKIAAFMPKSMTQALSYINISKGLPDSMEEALVYAFFKSRTAKNEEYLDIMNRFVSTWQNNPEGYNRRSTVLTDMLRFDEADADLKKYLELSTDKNTAHYNVARNIFNKLQFQPEVPYDKWSYDLVLEHLAQSEGINTMTLKAQTLCAIKKDAEALAIYEELCRIDTLRTPQILYAISLCHENLGDSISEVLAPLDSAIALMGSPTPKEAATFILRRGKLLANAGRYKEAVLEYNTYCSLLDYQVNATFYYDRSQIELNARMYQQALDDIEMAISSAPNNALYRIEKAAICLRVNMLDECVEACEYVTSRTEKFSDAFRILGYALLQKGDKEGARRNLKKAVELGDDSAQEIIDAYLK